MRSRAEPNAGEPAVADADKQPVFRKRAALHISLGA